MFLFPERCRSLARSQTRTIRHCLSSTSPNHHVVALVSPSIFRSTSPSRFRMSQWTQGLSGAEAAVRPARIPPIRPFRSAVSRRTMYEATSSSPSPLRRQCCVKTITGSAMHGSTSLAPLLSMRRRSHDSPERRTLAVGSQVPYDARDAPPPIIRLAGCRDQESQ
jgi:hypothetical protein